METFSFRSLLYASQSLAFAGLALSALYAVYWLFLRPILARARGGSGELALAGVEGGVVEAGSPSPQGVVGRLDSLLAPLLPFLGFATNCAAMIARWLEVRHWPAQTMYEVVPLGTTMGFLAGGILYFVLRFHRARGLGRGFVHLFMMVVYGLCSGFLSFALSLDPTGRALPPALQSYWFPTHISAYMLGYFTLFIAAGATWLYFCCRIWRGFIDRDVPRVDRRTATLAGIAMASCIPFGSQAVLAGPGLFLLCGVVMMLSRRIAGTTGWFDPIQKNVDRFTWRIFVVGFPFLTAGLIQGALWAQESWAIYWGWDSKEVSALISWLFYAVYLHLRFVAGWRGERGMWILLFGGLSVYITFQLFGFLPASQTSLHRYTDMDVVPAEGMMGAPTESDLAAR